MKIAMPRMALELAPRHGCPATVNPGMSMQPVAKSRGLAGYVVRAPILAACALTLAACGGAAQMMDGTPHADSISPTVEAPAGASTDYGSARDADGDAGEARPDDVGLTAENAERPAPGAMAGASSDDPDADERAVDGAVAAVSDADGSSGSSGSSGDGMTATEGARLSERGFFGIAEPIRRAEQPAAAAPQRRQLTEEEAQSRARRDALASIVGQFDSPSGRARSAPEAASPDQDPRIADVPDRPDDAPSEEELAAMRSELESSRDRARAASEGRAERIETEAETDDPFAADPADTDESGDETEAGATDLSDPAAMMGAAESQSGDEQTPDQASSDPESSSAPASVASTVTIPFEAGSADLAGDARRMVTDLAGDPTLEGASIRVVGYATEDDGGESTAQSRASAVADALNGALASADVSGVSVQVETALSPDEAPAAQASRVDIRINE